MSDVATTQDIDKKKKEKKVKKVTTSPQILRKIVYRTLIGKER